MPGTLRIADYALGPVAGADVLTASELAVVDLPALEGWDARALARTLAHELDTLGLRKLPLSVVHPTLPERLCAEASPARVAAQLDRPEARAALAEAVAGLGAEGRVLLFPPVLGLDAHAPLIAALEAASGSRVGEALAFPPHAVNGYRLQRALDAALRRAGVERVSARVRSVAAAENDRLALTLADGQGRGIEADAVVLATGRFVGGGLEAASEAVREPLLALPLYDGDGRRVDGIPAVAERAQGLRQRAAAVLGRRAHRSAAAPARQPRPPAARAPVRRRRPARRLRPEPRAHRPRCGAAVGDPRRPRGRRGAARAGGRRGRARGHAVRGYRGFMREFSRTGSLRALSLQLRTGVAHIARQWFGRKRSDPVAQFMAYYGPDGVARPEAGMRALALVGPGLPRVRALQPRVRARRRRAGDRSARRRGRGRAARGGLAPARPRAGAGGRLCGLRRVQPSLPCGDPDPSRASAAVGRAW